MAFLRVLFLMDAERAHNIVTALLVVAAKFFPTLLGRLAPAGTTSKTVLGLRFRSQVGLAAGFDKDARLVRAMDCLGFGFIEVGTVTPLPQAGHARPRLFREPSRQVIFNRMGFNNHGAEAAAQRIRRVRPKLSEGFRVGVNIGKNKDTPEENAHEDYRKAVTPFEGLVDYVVVNVSSPNTAGLRNLQSVELLQKIVASVMGVVKTWAIPVPVLVKLAPEIKAEELSALLSAGKKWGLGGFVLTNTLSGTWETGPEDFVSGGLSGSVLTDVSRSRLEEARAQTDLALISVGGILDRDEARRRLSSGADLIQVYAGFVFKGLKAIAF